MESWYTRDRHITILLPFVFGYSTTKIQIRYSVTLNSDSSSAHDIKDLLMCQSHGNIHENNFMYRILNGVWGILGRTNMTPMQSSNWCFFNQNYCSRLFCPYRDKSILARWLTAIFIDPLLTLSLLIYFDGSGISHPVGRSVCWPGGIFPRLSKAVRRWERSM